MAASKLEIIADPDKPTIVTRRELAAPRALVFDAFTKPELIMRWLGPRAFTWVKCESDLRVGGRYRWVHRAPDGQEYGFSGEFTEIDRPGRLVRTYVFDPFPEAVALETLTLEEREGRTVATTLTVHKTIEARNGHISGGQMEKGMTEGYARLDELLAESSVS